MSDEIKENINLVVPVAVLLMLTALVDELDATDNTLGQRIIDKFKSLKDDPDNQRRYPESAKLIDACIADLERTRHERVKRS